MSFVSELKEYDKEKLWIKKKKKHDEKLKKNTKATKWKPPGDVGIDLEPRLSSTQRILMSTYLRRFANILLLLRSLDCLQTTLGFWRLTRDRGLRVWAGWNDSRAGCRLSFLNGRTLNVSTSFHFPSFCHVYFLFPVSLRLLISLAAGSLWGTASDYACNQQLCN